MKTKGLTNIEKEMIPMDMSHVDNQHCTLSNETY